MWMKMWKMWIVWNQGGGGKLFVTKNVEKTGMLLRNSGLRWETYVNKLLHKKSTGRCTEKCA